MRAMADFSITRPEKYAPIGDGCSIPVAKSVRQTFFQEILEVEVSEGLDHQCQAGLLTERVALWPVS